VREPERGSQRETGRLRECDIETCLYGGGQTLCSRLKDVRRGLKMYRETEEKRKSKVMLERCCEE
jgi:hypothetical protein